jgi:hypothetical protein
MTNVIPIRPPPPFEPEYTPPFEPEYTMKRERDKLLYVAELLEEYGRDYRVDWFFPRCHNCERIDRSTRRFEAMAKRIRRFWSWAVRPVSDEQLDEMIQDNLKVLNWTKKGSIPILCDPARDIAIARELQRLRVENAELREQLNKSKRGVTE